MLVASRLAKAGYGRPREILDSRVDDVIYWIEYEIFLKKYESRFHELNRPEAKK